jgi:hypothetical protein
MTLIQFIIAVIGIVLIWLGFRFGILGLKSFGNWLRAKIHGYAYLIPIGMYALALIIAIDSGFGVRRSEWAPLGWVLFIAGALILLALGISSK